MLLARLLLGVLAGKLQQIGVLAGSSAACTAGWALEISIEWAQLELQVCWERCLWH